LGPSFATGQRSGELAHTLVRGVEDTDAYLSRYVPQLALAVLVPMLVLAAVLAADPLSALVLVVTFPLVPIFMALLGALARGRAPPPVGHPPPAVRPVSRIAAGSRDAESARPRPRRSRGARRRRRALPRGHDGRSARRLPLRPRPGAAGDAQRGDRGRRGRPPPSLWTPRLPPGALRPVARPRVLPSPARARDVLPRRPLRPRGRRSDLRDPRHAGRPVATDRRRAVARGALEESSGDRLRRRALRLRRRPRARGGRRLLQGRGRGDARPRGPHGRGQDDAGPPAPALPRARCRSHPRRRPADRRRRGRGLAPRRG